MARTINTTASHIIDRTDLVTAFLADARRYNVLPEEETVALIAKAKAGDINSQNKVINHNLRFIFSLCSQFAKGDKVIELCSVASIGMIKAIASFDATLGFKFLSYAVHYMRMEISEYFRTVEPFIKVSNSAKIGSKANKAAEKFYQHEMRMPSEDELIEILENEYGITIKDKRDIMSVQLSSMSEPVGDEDATAEECGEIAVLTATTNEYVEVAEKEEQNRMANLFLSTLNMREATIMRMLFGMGEWQNNAQSEEAVADRYGMTAERIRQIKESCLVKLRTRQKRVLAMV